MNDFPADFDGRSHAISFVLNDTAYVGTGIDQKDLWKYDPISDSWTEMNDFPAGFDGRERAISFVLDGEAYVGMGQNKYDLWKYDPVLDTWIQLNDVPFYNALEPAVFILLGEVYMGAGDAYGGNDKKFLKYDPITDAWIQLNDFPSGFEARNRSIGFSIGNHAFVGTGSSPNGELKDLWKYDPQRPYLLTVNPSGEASWFDPSNNDIIDIEDADADPTNELQDWSNLPGIPNAFTELPPVDDTWTQVGDFPVDFAVRYEAMSFTLNEVVYIGLGGGNTGLKDDLWKYDSNTDTWTQLNDFPAGFSARTGVVSFVVNGNAYVGTGANSTYHKDLWKYDPITDSWTQLNDFPADFDGRSHAISFVLNDTAYVGTGIDQNDLWKYDSALDNWTQLNDIPAAFGGRTRATAFVLDGEAYVGSGQNKRDLWKYEPLTDSWIQLNDFPSFFIISTNPIVFKLEGVVYAGTGTYGNSLDKGFWKYDPVTDTWIELNDFPSDFEARQRAVSFTIGSEAFIGTGHSQIGQLKDLWKYKPNPPYALNVKGNGDGVWVDPSSINIDDADADPTNELQDWSNLPGIPIDFSDGTDAVDDADADPANELITTAILNGNDFEITDAGGTKTIDLSSLAGSDSTTVADSDNIDLTLTNAEITAQVKIDAVDLDNILSSSTDGLKALEADPEVGVNTTNYLPKWDGSALVQSSSVFEDANGNVGVGNTAPEEKLEVSGTIKTDGIIMPTDAAMNHILKSDASGNASWQSLIDTAYYPEPNLALSSSLGIGSQPIFVTVQDDYAYVVDYTVDDLKVIDVSDRNNPIEKSSFAVGNQPKGVAVQGDYAYVINSTAPHFKIIDVSNPSSPALSGSLNIGGGPESVMVQGHYAYVVINGSGLKIIDISIPATPVEIGSLPIGATTFGAVQGNYVYLVEVDGGQLKVVDVSDPSNPMLVSNFGSFSIPEIIAVQGDYVYILSNGLEIIDVSNPALPTLSGQVNVNYNSLCLSIKGNYAYTASNSGVTAINIGDPNNPFISNSGGGTLSPRSIVVQDNYAYVADDGGFNALKIIKLSEIGAIGVNLNGDLEAYTDADNDPTNELQDWSNLPGIPTAFSDGIDNVDDADADPSNELQNWVNLPGIPAVFSDGIDNVNDSDADPTNELISTAILNGTNLEITDAGGTKTVNLSSLGGSDSTTVTDSDNIDLTLTNTEISAQVKLDAVVSNNIMTSSTNGLKAIEADPQVGSNSFNYLPKWNGTALVESNSVFEDANGNVGIGTEAPDGPLEVKVPGYSETVIEQTVWTQWSPFSSDIWQTFFLVEGGILTSIDVATNITGPITLSIYYGYSTIDNGFLLYSETAEAPFTNSLSSPFVLSTPLNLPLDASWYTFRIHGGNAGFFGANNTDPYSGGESNLGAGVDYQFRVTEDLPSTPVEALLVTSTGDVGIGRTATTNKLEVEGEASKTTAGSWVGNSDKRLKKDIKALNSQHMLDQLLALQGVTYQWNDDKTGSKRPDGIQYGFIAQNIQAVFPSLVAEDNLGYLQTAYGTYDAMTVEAIRALNLKIENLDSENSQLKTEVFSLQTKLSEMDQLKQRMARLEAVMLVTEQSKSKISE
ncbi:MAG: N-acetylneuraminic acid mutarotase [Halioglobus sp.]